MKDQSQPATASKIISSNELFDHWQGHSRVTRRVIEAFPEDKLFGYSVGGMRPFADMVKEIMGMSATGVKGLATTNWEPMKELDYHAGTSNAGSKAELLATWDKVSDMIFEDWQRIPERRFQEIVLAFGQYEGDCYGIILYFIDNEIHHRAQATVYLRTLGIEPPAFWDRG
jgi:uncharacterized damage-inducible protein DinB